jgi:beta-fructofuranosidase
VLVIDTDWVWDSWYVTDNSLHHAFFLRAARSLGEPGLRHHHASIGHATSNDLTAWTVHDDALRASTSPSWDDQALWTGCVVRGPHEWIMFYTGISRGDRCAVQRIGAALSEDLHTWRRLGDDPLVTADARWYETDPNRTIDGVAWRDPWVFIGDDARWHMLVTASARDADPALGGVVGHAVSDDLRNWEVLPPLTSPGHARCLEVPQIVTLKGRHILVYCAPRRDTEGRLEPLGDTWLASATTRLGPYDLDRAHRPTDSGLYAGRFVEVEPGRWVMMGFRNESDDRFTGMIEDPLPMNVDQLLSTLPAPSTESEG